MPIPAAEVTDTQEAQDARWSAWERKGAAADRLTARRMRIAVTVILVTAACLALAAVL